MAPIWAFLAALALGSQAVLASDSPPKCGAGSKCPKDKPCCSQYGECGTGSYCLGGCDPRQSYSLDACVAEPICKSGSFKFDNLDRVANQSDYLGDASKYDWVASGTPKISDGSLLLTMPPKSVGTLVSSNRYMWYGKTSARMKTSRGKGVVTAFILLSDVKDEIDYEFIGTQLDHAQTNYYFQGITDYKNEKNGQVSGSNTFEDFHDYEIDWKPDQITWSIDGNNVRTLKKSDTYNHTSKQYSYPQTPARVELSLWPGGSPSEAKGTIEWAGGEIDWDSDDIKKYGYDYATFANVTIECYDPPNGTKKNGSEAYIFTDDKGLQSSIEITDRKNVLESLDATGLDVSKGGPKSSSGSGSSSGGDGSGSGNSKGGGSGDNGSKNFSQGKGGKTSGAQSPNERVLNGSFFAVLVAVVVLVSM